jgi:hypothetical protein
MREILVFIMYRGRKPFEGFLGLKGFLLQHDELFKFIESYEMEGT